MRRKSAHLSFHSIARWHCHVVHVSGGVSIRSNVLQVCLMSQSWDNVANITMVDCQYSAHAQINVAPNFEPMLSWCRPHPTLQAKSSCSNSSCNECRIYHQAMTKNRPHLLLHSRLERSMACWAGLSKCVALCDVRSRMRLCGHPRLCTRHHNSDQS